MAVIHGIEGLVSFSANGDADIVSQCNQWEMRYGRDFARVAIFRQSHKSGAGGAYEWGGSFSGSVLDTGAVVMTTAVAYPTFPIPDGTILLTYKDATTTDGSFTGVVSITGYTLSVNTDGISIISGTFEGTGNFTHANPA